MEASTASLKTQNLAWETTRKYRTILNRLLDWCDGVGIKLVCELGVTRMDDFRGTWNYGPNYATKNFERRAFFAFCVERDRRATIGVILAVAAARVMTTLFYGARPDYIGVLAGVSFMLLAIAALASIVPARRASRIDPVIALQQE